MGIFSHLLPLGGVFVEGVLNMFQELWAGRRIKGRRLDRIKIRLILRRCADRRIEAVKVVKREERATKRYRLVRSD